jgi:DNA-binding NarL/FixJ family response regulator
MKTISIAIADDETLFRKGMSLLLNGHDNLQVDLEAGNGVDLLEKLAAVENITRCFIARFKNAKNEWN